MIIVDQAQKDLDKARALYRRRYNRAYNLSEQGYDQKANALLAQANARLAEAEARFARARSRDCLHASIDANARCIRCGTFCG